MKKTVKKSRRLFSEERQSLILTLLSGGARTLEELSSELNVSPATVRRDLLILEQAGKIRRTHGGAILPGMTPSEPLFNDKKHLMEKEKKYIASKAASFLRDGETIYLDGGSTVLALCPHILSRSEITVVTNSISAAEALMDSRVKLYMISGRVRSLSRTLVGSLSEKSLKIFSFDKAFLGTISVDEEGISTTDPDEAYTKELVLKSAKTAILLVDSSKIGTKSNVYSGNFSDLDIIITDKRPPANFAKHCSKNDVKLIY